MKTYGKDRKAYANRKRRGTSMACPCCIPRATHRKSKTRVYKKRARQAGKILGQSGDIG